MAENGVRFVPGDWNAICSSCEQSLPLSAFYLHSNGRPRKQCKLCRNSSNNRWKRETKNHLKLSPEQRERALARTRKWRESNKAYDAQRSAARRGKVKQATPSWANTDKIVEIYKNCPTGYHVDHIIPLNAEDACGLHVEHNLQYLTAEENWRKGNGRKWSPVRPR